MFHGCRRHWETFCCYLREQEAQSSSQGGLGLAVGEIEFLLPVSSVTWSVFLKPPPPLPWVPFLSIPAMIKVQKGVEEDPNLADRNRASVVEMSGDKSQSAEVTGDVGFRLNIHHNRSVLFQWLIQTRLISHPSFASLTVGCTEAIRVQCEHK